MGNSASIAGSKDTHLTIEEVRNLPEVGNKFNERVFDVYKDGNGKISKKRALELGRIKYDAFISHDRGVDELNRNTNDRVISLGRGLRDHEINSKLDDNTSLTNSDRNEMIDLSQIFIVCVTKSYELKLSKHDNSDHIVKDFFYAEKKRTPKFMIPIILEPRMKDPKTWSGPLKLALSNHSVIDFTRDEVLYTAIEQLVDTIYRTIVPMREWNLATPMMRGSAVLSPAPGGGFFTPSPAHNLPQQMLTSQSSPALPPIRDHNQIIVERLTKELDIKHKELDMMREELNGKTKELQTAQTEIMNNKREIEELKNKVMMLSNNNGGGVINHSPLDHHLVGRNSSSNMSRKSGILSSKESLLGNGNTVTEKRVYEGRCVYTLTDHSHYIYSITVGKNGDIFSGSRDKTIRQWREGDQSMESIQTFIGHSNWVTALVALDDNDLLISGGLDKTIKFWSIATGQCNKTLTNHTAEVCCIILWQPNIIISGGCDKELRLWDIAQGTQTKSILGAEGDIWCFAKISESILAAGEYDDGNDIRIYDVDQGVVLQVLHGHEDWVRGLALGLKGELISVSKDCHMKIWELEDKNINNSYKLSKTITHPLCEWGLLSILVLKDGSYITASNDYLIRQWDEENNYTAPIKVFTGHTNTVRCMALTNEEDIVSAGDDKTVRYWI
eukprot:CAMPEP_0182421000 /NCGR_PEP_ID=MMETSP1167-20130531/6146_1 /TAXON_ID=2988 /ORGANISM="Mallomonas Sp, Strain CCMP3275" /LENGTH=670 /DNA_ID=CAMNT_0024597657 /DNA_START=71 /DNA_END=2083 /DNA_ORIENTATION=-